ncbi:NAD(P)-dependent oxidoreductase [Halobacteriovorax sp. HLS]|uniref:NAD(P)-dependent oxidoreductase n=1 Tax=Halobacteriovorax sp. HLS TaxID=2234000 RepID=UPI000FD80BF1|nr:NAD(P)-dependent oxidoreductase [Halobacteriovorax sp. HLS]
MNKANSLTHIHIIGAGPSGLFCSYLLLKSGFKVSLYDQMSGVGKKFLVAGNGGLNLTHSEKVGLFSKKYGENEQLFYSLLQDFSNIDLRSWCEEIGVETFVGSSGRVFPKEFKAAQLLSRWVSSLKDYPNFSLHLKTKFKSLTGNTLEFENQDKCFSVVSDRAIFCLGGASWSKTGSDGMWTNSFNLANEDIIPFRAMNCGFNSSWSTFFKDSFDTFPLKNISLSHQDLFTRGELMVTQYGIEGGAIYALSRSIQEELCSKDAVIVFLDLLPDLNVSEVHLKLDRKRSKDSMSNHLRKSFNFDGHTRTLIKELCSKETFSNMEALAKALKKLPIKIISARPLDEAISTSGGISLNSVDENFQAKKLSGVYFAGEMLNWDAPTGGYLLQGCFSIAYRIVQSIKKSYQYEK